MKILKITASILLVLVICCACAFGSIELYKKYIDDTGKNQVNSVQAGIISSEKYGTFEIPEQNMFLTLNMSALAYWQNGTDFTYFFDEYMNVIAKMRSIDAETFKGENRMILNVGRANSNWTSSEEFNTFISSESYPFTNATSYYKSNEVILDLNNNILSYDWKKLVNFSSSSLPSPYLYTEFALAPKSGLNTANKDISSTYDRLSYNETSMTGLQVRCLAKKVEYTADGVTTTIYLPVVLNSDKNYPLTESVYNEIIASKK